MWHPSVWMDYVNLLKKGKITWDFTEFSFPTSTMWNYLDYHIAKGGHLLT